MKRSRPMNRAKAPMKRTPLKAGKPLAAGKPLERKTPLKRGRWTRVTWELWDKLDAAAHAEWKRKVTRLRCARCAARGREHDADNRRDPHHILPARYLRRYVRGLRLPADEARVLLRSLLYDPRNGMCLCRKCHENHENASHSVLREMIPAKAWQFAEELGMAHVLERLYPETE